MSAQVLAKSDSEDAPRNQPNNPGVGGLVGVRLKDRFDIWPSVPLNHLDVPGAAAYGASDLVTGNDKLFALVCDGSVVPRTDIMGKLQEVHCAELLRLIDWGTMPWSADQQDGGEPNRLIVIYERPVGARLVSDLSAVVPPMSEYDVLRCVLMPAVAALSHLSAYSVIHRGIRPTNLFYRDGTRQSIMLGDCVTTPPAYAQPALFESIESAMATPAGRGSGVRRHDIYALGVTMLFLLLGRRPAPELNDEALLVARLAQGSYATLVGRASVPATLREPLRGMLNDDPDQRWELEDLEKWLVDRRLKPSHTHQIQKALRPFNFEGQNYYTCRSLANAIARQWRSHVMIDRKTELITWIERSLGDGVRRDAVERAYEQLGGGLVGGGSGPAIFNARLAMALDPMAPLRYKGFAATMEGLGPALAASFNDSAKVQEFAEIVRAGLPIFWLDLQRFGDRDLVRTAGVFRRLGSFLKDSRPGSGIERCLYELNPGQHCLSPLVERDHVVAINQLLPALEQNAPRDGTPFDRHIAAFIAARMGEEVSGPIGLAGNRDNPMEATIGLLALLATLQWQLGPATLPGLTRWLANSIQPIVGGYRHRAARKRIETDLPNLIKGGSVVGLYNFLINSDLKRQDEEGFAAAVAQYSKTEFEIAFLESGGASDPERAQRYGQQLAATCSAALGLLAVVVLTLARL